jgi:hypothetical protein
VVLGLAVGAAERWFHDMETVHEEEELVTVRWSAVRGITGTGRKSNLVIMTYSGTGTNSYVYLLQIKTQISEDYSKLFSKLQDRYIATILQVQGHSQL